MAKAQPDPGSAASARKRRKGVAVNLELEGKAAFVAGSSRGIGLAIAQTFREEGAHVVISGRDRIALARAARELERLGGNGEVLATQGDLSEHGDIERCV